MSIEVIDHNRDITDTPVEYALQNDLPRLTHWVDPDQAAETVTTR